MAKYWNMSVNDLTVSGNQIKEVFLENMKKEGHLTQKQCDKMNEYCVIYAEKSYFGKFWDKITWKNNDDLKIIVVKLVG